MNNIIARIRPAKYIVGLVVLAGILHAGSLFVPVHARGDVVALASQKGDRTPASVAAIDPTALIALGDGAPHAVVAMAPGVAPATPFKVSDLLDWLLKLAGIAAAAAVPILVQRFLGPKASAQTLATYSQLAIDGVAHAEELGHQAIKSGRPRLDASVKANAAVDYVLRGADALKLRPMAEGALRNLIVAKVGAIRGDKATDLKIQEPTTTTDGK